MRKTVNRRKSAILALFATLIILSVLTGCLTGCSSGTTYSYYIREEAEITKTDYTGYNVLPKPEGKTQTTIQYINLDGESWATLMLMETLQGNVNRENPSMYIVHNYIVEGNPSLNATQYWLDKLDETYVDEDGNPVFEKVEYTDYYKMLLDNLDKVSGGILYDSRLTDSGIGGKGA